MSQGSGSTAAPPPWIAAQRAHLLAQRGHAWLLHGPSGLGQFPLALELVRAWLCESPATDGSACGQCASCHAIDVHTHADLCVLMPETEMLAQGWPLPEKAQAEIDDKKRKPSAEIRVEAMRDAVEFAQRTSARGRGKAVLVYPAEQMNHVTANALLKTLEEPPGDVRFVLASEAAHQLLPTIRSRCLGHAMAWPDDAQMQAWLARRACPAQPRRPGCALQVGALTTHCNWPTAAWSRRPGPTFPRACCAVCPPCWRRPARRRPSPRCKSFAMTSWLCKWVPRRATLPSPTCRPRLRWQR